jgi:hypothetical protein
MTNRRSKDPDAATAHAHGAQAGVGTTTSRKDEGRSFSSDVVDTDIGAAEGQKRGTFQDSNMSASDNESMRNFRDQIIQNAITASDMATKQVLRSQELAIDRMWNINETDAYATILANRVAEILKGDK